MTSEPCFRPTRSWHFVPAHRTEHLQKALSLPADVLVFDLEDGVPVDQKETARRNLRKFFRRLSSGETARFYLRVNAEEPHVRADVRLLKEVGFGGVVLPKIQSAESLRRRARAIGRAGPNGRVVLIESFRAMANLGAILDATRLSGVGLGLEDLFSEIDLSRHESAELAKHLRLRVVVEAKARNLVAVDSVSLALRDPSRLARECAESRSLGFDGMFSIHPGQVEPINAAFAPRRRDVLWAQRIARLSSLTDGTGYSRRGRELISPPKIRKARRILRSG